MNVPKNRQQKKRETPGKTPSQRSVSNDQPETGTPATRPLQRRIISVFILFHLIAITCWAIPLDLFPLRMVRQFVRPYMLWAGLFQSWDTFAPNPRPVNSYIKAVVTTQNHHIKVWTFPRMEQLSFSERYSKERYRKFAEVLSDQSSAALWPDVADHIARSFTSQTDAPNKVLLIQFRADIKPAADGPYDQIPRSSIFYEKYLQPGDLK